LLLQVGRQVFLLDALEDAVPADDTAHHAVVAKTTGVG
jgi:hypothetical protein